MSVDPYKTKYFNAQKNIRFKQFDSTGNAIKVMCFAERTTKIIHYSESLTGDEVISEKYEIRFFQNDKEYVLMYSKGINAVSVIQFEGDTFNIVNFSNAILKKKRYSVVSLFKEKMKIWQQ